MSSFPTSACREMTGVEFLRQAVHLSRQRAHRAFRLYRASIDHRCDQRRGDLQIPTKPWDDSMIRANIAEAFRHKELVTTTGVWPVNWLVPMPSCRACWSKSSVVSPSTKSRSMLLRRFFIRCRCPSSALTRREMMVFANPEADSFLGKGEALLGETAAERLPPEFLAHLEGEGRGDFSGCARWPAYRAVPAHGRSFAIARLPCGRGPARSWQGVVANDPTRNGLTSGAQDEPSQSQPCRVDFWRRIQ